MRAVIQRVTEAKVTVDGAVTGAIGKGLLVLLGIAKGDQQADADWMLEKIINLRIFDDDAGKMNWSLVDVAGGLLVVSQFTLYGDTKRGRRPGFDQAARPEQARELYDYFIERARTTGLAMGAGVFQAHMVVTLSNDGPVTLICESPAAAGL